MTLLKPIGSLWSSCLFLLLAAGSVSVSHAQGLVQYPFEESLLAAQQESISRMPDRLNSNPLLENYDVKFYGLDVEADNRSDRIHGNTSILVEVRSHAFDMLVFELYRTLEVDQVLVDGEEVSYTHDGDELYIDLSAPRDSGSLVTAQIFFGGQTGEGMVMETDDEWGIPVSYTSSEPFYSRDWFPCKQDLRDKADSVHVFITTDYSLMGVSNGIHTGTTYFPDGRVRYEWKSNYPIDFYLISIAVADYTEYNLEAEVNGVSTPIFIQNFIYDVLGCLDTYREQIDVTIPIMEVFCQYFGPYPHREEKYGHYLWPRGGGMEHQTMTGMGHFEFYLVAHELGHSWFGNYVTCATWQDIWINEGFATFAGYLATEILGPEYAYGEREYRFDRALLEPDGSVYVPEEDADDASRIFSGNLSYNKGMALLYMIRFELQDNDLFYLALRNYLDRYANDVATGLEFKEVLEETTGMDFTDFFDQWYFGAGYPIYDVTWEQQGNQLTLHSSQSTSSTHTPLFKMSMEYNILHAEGDTTVRVFHGANEESHQFQIPYVVNDIVIDPGNHVLDGADQEAKHAAIDKDLLLFSIAPNPNQGLFYFSMKEPSGN
ncbi:MAG: M1 family metallopeptidase, partial [Bacteroidota bacterium]|nr:M1 family metallopeptidase [Bacteroidota bacterium]